MNKGAQMIDIIDDKDVMKIGREIVGGVTCCICGGKETGLCDGSQHWLRYYDEKGNWDKKTRMSTIVIWTIKEGDNNMKEYEEIHDLKNRLNMISKIKISVN